MEAPVYLAPPPIDPITNIQMHLQIYIPQREHYTVIADETGNHNFPACLHGQAEIYAGAYSCIARFLPESLSKTSWSQSACIKFNPNHQLQETPARIIPRYYLACSCGDFFPCYMLHSVLYSL